MMSDVKERRDAAVKRLEAKRDFRTHAAVYVLVNLLLVAIWAISGAGGFWPIWTMVPWGVGLAFHAWAAYARHGITEDEIEREMARDHPH